MKVIIADIPYPSKETMLSLESNEKIVVHIRGNVIDIVIDDVNLAQKMYKVLEKS